MDHQPDTPADIVYLVVGRKGVSAISASALKHARETAGLDQAELGRRLGVHKNTVGSWETGHRRPDPRILPALAAALDVEPEALFEPGTAWTLQRLREVAGLSQDDVADRVPGLTREVWAKIERGERELHRHELQPIAAALGLTRDVDRLVTVARGRGGYLAASVRLDPDVVARMEQARLGGESYNDLLRRLLPPAGD